MASTQTPERNRATFAAEFHLAATLQYIGQQPTRTLHPRLKSGFGKPQLTGKFALGNLFKIRFDESGAVRLSNLIGHWPQP